ncbi:hypothetical protein TIFTF001_001401 [Ficus carica]|uniref:Uncharacterized protein n=1 Tax=Ficus carica TaxID=3494 RepID=A0AA88CR34_FICCA|nr:hypothetical protein TIFTF001_001401 [Ficus carica]
MDNLENLNHDLEFIVEKSSLSSGPIGYSSNAIYIASSSSYNIDFIKEESVSRWKRNVRCRSYARDLKDMQSHLQSHIMYLLLNQWKNKGHGVQVFNQLPRRVSYHITKKRGGGHWLRSAFNGVSNWKSFSVDIKVKNMSEIES